MYMYIHHTTQKGLWRKYISYVLYLKCTLHARTYIIQHKKGFPALVVVAVGRKFEGIAALIGSILYNVPDLR